MTFWTAKRLFIFNLIVFRILFLFLLITSTPFARMFAIYLSTDFFFFSLARFTSANLKNLIYLFFFPFHFNSSVTLLTNNFMVYHLLFNRKSKILPSLKHFFFFFFVLVLNTSFIIHRRKRKKIICPIWFMHSNVQISANKLFTKYSKWNESKEGDEENRKTHIKNKRNKLLTKYLSAGNFYQQQNVCVDRWLLFVFSWNRKWI